MLFIDRASSQHVVCEYVYVCVCVCMRARESAGEPWLPYQQPPARHLQDAHANGSSMC